MSDNNHIEADENDKKNEIRNGKNYKINAKARVKVTCEEKVKLSFHEDIRLPPKAPVFWRDRDKSLNETPIDFTKRIYKEFLGNGMTRADLRRLDKGLEKAITNYCYRKKLEVTQELNLPTKSELAKEMIKRTCLLYTSPSPRDRG